MEISNNSSSIVYVNNQKLKPNDTIKLNDVNISEDNKITVKLKFKEDSKNTIYEVNTLPSDFPKYEINGKSNYDGDYYFIANCAIKNSQGSQIATATYLMIVSQEGKIKYYKYVPNETYMFRKNETEDGIRYTYLTATEENQAPEADCGLIVLDENFNQINKILYTLEDGTKTSLNSHDYIYINDEHYILATNVQEERNDIPESLGYGSNMEVTNCMIEEINNGQIVWQFESTDYIELYEQYDNTREAYTGKVSEQGFKNYMHFNSMAIDTNDNNLVCSFRGTNSIMKISRETGEIIWTLGGKGDEFGLTEEQKFKWQHSVSIQTDGSILLYDNQNPTDNSRILKIKINEEDKKIEKYEEYETGVNSVTHASVQVVDEENNIYLICYGAGMLEDALSVEEKNLETGEIYFAFDIKDDLGIYEAFKIQ